MSETESVPMPKGIDNHGIKRKWSSDEDDDDNNKVITVHLDLDAFKDAFVNKLPKSVEIYEADYQVVNEILQQQRDERAKRFQDYARNFEANSDDAVNSADDEDVSLEESFRLHDELEDGYQKFYRWSDMIRISETDSNRRVYGLAIPKLDGDVPPSVLRLDALRILDLSFYNRVPPWIGELHDRLTEIVLPASGVDHSSLPDGIWTLTKLQVFRQDNESYRIDHGTPLGGIGNLKGLRELTVARVSGLPDKLQTLQRLEKLTILRPSFEMLPGSVCKIPNLKTLGVKSHNPKAFALPETIADMTCLEELDIKFMKIRSLPAAIGTLANLKILRLICTRQLTGLPESIGNLTRLEELNMKSSGVQSLPDSFRNLTNLKILRLDNIRQLLTLPECVCHFLHLEEMHLIGSGITSLPASIGNLANLKLLNLGKDSQVVTLPDSIGNLTNLEDLRLKGEIASLPDSIGNLANLKILGLVGATNLVTLPDSIGNCTRLEELYLRKSEIQKLPASFGNLANLKKLHLSDTKQLVALPESFGNLTNLKALQLDRSEIELLPCSFGKLANLRHLNLRSTHNLKELPCTFGNLMKLESLYLFDSGLVASNGILSANDKKLVLKLPSLVTLKVGLLDRDIIRRCIFNRARLRIFNPERTNSDQLPVLTLSLWPLILAKGATIFDAKYDPLTRMLHNPSENRQKDSIQSDAIFLLLVDYGAALLSCNSKAST